MTIRSLLLLRSRPDASRVPPLAVWHPGARGLVPLALALLGFVPAAAALPVLSEVYYDAPGSDDGESFVEIAGLPGTPLDGLVVEGINGSNGAAGPSIVLAGAIGGDGLFVLADRRADGSTSVVGADLLANFDFQNGPDSIVLRGSQGVLDAVGYGVFGMDEIFAGEGSPAPDAAAGSSLARLIATLDSDDNLADFGVREIPTPGVAVFPVVPEPGTVVLLGGGLVGLACSARRAKAAKSGTWA